MRFMGETEQLERFLYGHSYTLMEIARILATLKEETASGVPSLETGCGAVKSWAARGDSYLTIIHRLKGVPA